MRAPGDNTPVASELGIWTLKVGPSLSSCQHLAALSALPAGGSQSQWESPSLPVYLFAAASQSQFRFHGAERFGVKLSCWFPQLLGSQNLLVGMNERNLGRSIN